MEWRFEFQECGGYDCMSDAFNIFNEKNELICDIDCATISKGEAEKLAKLIVDSVNQRLNETSEGAE